MRIPILFLRRDVQSELVMWFCSLFNLNANPFAFTCSWHQADFSSQSSLGIPENPVMFRKSSGNVVLHTSPAYRSDLGLQCPGYTSWCSRMGWMTLVVGSVGEGWRHAVETSDVGQGVWTWGRGLFPSLPPKPPPIARHAPRRISCTQALHKPTKLAYRLLDG